MRRAADLIFGNSLLLILGAAAGLAWANIDPASYRGLVHARLPLGENGLDLLFVVNEMLMAFFFALAGKEIWEAMLPGGPFHDIRRAVTPIVATLGGMAGPAILYLAGAAAMGNWAPLAKGWAIPCATDIAFSYLVARFIFGPRHPAIPFLLLLAIGDDFVGLLVLAVFYAQGHVTLTWMLLAAAGVGLGLIMRRRGVRRWWWYILGPGTLCWLGFELSGLRPALGLLPVVPLLPHWPQANEADPNLPPEQTATLRLFERHLERPVEVVLMLFGLFNAGTPLAAPGTVTLLVLAALLVGKPLGIFGTTMLFTRGFKTGLPSGLSGREVLVLGCVAGIGFTVSLFVATVAFGAGPVQDAAKLGAIASFAAALGAIVVARLCGLRRMTAPKEQPC